MTALLRSLLIVTSLLVAALGLLSLATFVMYVMARTRSSNSGKRPAAFWPSVVVQLPIYNEKYVVERLIRSVAALSYPRDRLTIQILDDSTDETSDLVIELVEQLRKAGTSVDHLRRTDRQGYKAGALKAGLSQTDADLVAIFDADFVPAADFLLQSVPLFYEDETLGLVQARWEHLNQSRSWLTRAQAMALDKHFEVDQQVRAEILRFPKFNGSAGVWRRECLLAVGGWLDDTLCEDLCLSTRAALAGWQMRYLGTTSAPADLPESMAAYRVQQYRWAKGSAQCLRKYWRQIATSRRHNVAVRLLVLGNLSGYLVHPLIIATLILQLAALLLDIAAVPVLIAGLLGILQPLLFLLAQARLGNDLKHRLADLPLLVVLTTGLAPLMSRAVFSGLLGLDSGFVRTPKRGSTSSASPDRDYLLPLDLSVLIELLILPLSMAGIGLAIQRAQPGMIPFFATVALGTGFVVWETLRDGLSTPALARRRRS